MPEDPTVLLTIAGAHRPSELPLPPRRAQPCAERTRNEHRRTQAACHVSHTSQGPGAGGAQVCCNSSPSSWGRSRAACRARRRRKSACARTTSRTWASPRATTPFSRCSATSVSGTTSRRRRASGRGSSPPRCLACPRSASSCRCLRRTITPPPSGRMSWVRTSAVHCLRRAALAAARLAERSAHASLRVALAWASCALVRS